MSDNTSEGLRKAARKIFWEARRIDEDELHLLAIFDREAVNLCDYAEEVRRASQGLDPDGPLSQSLQGQAAGLRWAANHLMDVIHMLRSRKKT